MDLVMTQMLTKKSKKMENKMLKTKAKKCHRSQLLEPILKTTELLKSENNVLMQFNLCLMILNLLVL
jgi:hypothetical protein